MADDNEETRDGGWNEINAASARKYDEEERAEGRTGLTAEERERYGVPTPPADESPVTDKARADAAEDRANAERVGFTVDDAAASRGEANAISRAEAAAMALGGIKGVGAAGRMVREAGAKASPAQWGIKEWQGIAASPQAEWDGVLKAQEDAATEQARLDRIGRSDAMVQQLIGAKTERVNARNAAKQQADDEFSALAAMCYVPGQDPFVDTDTLTQYNKNHPGNPITKMGRLSGGGLFVERAVMGDNGKPVMEAVFARGEDGKPVMRNGQPVIAGEKPKTAIEVIVPEQFQSRMKDFIGWEWDGVTKQFMTQSDFAKVKKSREDKAREEMYQKQLDADPRLRMADTKMRADLAAQQAQQEGGKGSGSRGASSSGGSSAGNAKPPTFDENLKKFEWMKSQLEEMGKELYDKNGTPKDPESAKEFEQFKARFKQFRAEMFGIGGEESAPEEGQGSNASRIMNAKPPQAGHQGKPQTEQAPAPQDSQAKPQGGEAKPKAAASTGDNKQQAALSRLQNMGNDAPTYTYKSGMGGGEEKTVSFAEALKMADEGDPGARAWIRDKLKSEIQNPTPTSEEASIRRVKESDAKLSVKERLEKNRSRKALADKMRASINERQRQAAALKQYGRTEEAEKLTSKIQEDEKKLAHVMAVMDSELLNRETKLKKALHSARHEHEHANPNFDQPGEIDAKRNRYLKAKAEWDKFMNGE